MPEWLLWSAAALGSMAALVAGADLFLGAAERAGLRLGLSPFLIGVTLLGAGTSLPELIAAVNSVLADNSSIAIGTAVGSNVTNILLILGATALIGNGLTVGYELVRVDLPFLFGSALLLAFAAMDGRVDWVDGVLGIAAGTVYIAYTMASPAAPATAVGKAATDAFEERAAAKFGGWGGLVVGLLLLQVGAYFTVESVAQLATLSGVAAGVLAASLVAVSTSLPELSVSIRAAQAGRPELAVGNVLGSNIFNALVVVGVSSLFGTLEVTPVMLEFVIPAMLGSTVLCFFVLQEREMTRWDGWLLLLLFAAFTLQLYRQ